MRVNRQMLEVQVKSRAFLPIQMVSIKLHLLNFKSIILNKFNSYYLPFKTLPELNGYMYPAYPNGYYNNFYYYNGTSTSRPPKMRRRKRFLNSRNSHQAPRSAETTTDYSDDDNTTYTKRFNPRYQNGWMLHNGYNHYNGKFHRVHMDQNVSCVNFDLCMTSKICPLSRPIRHRTNSTTTWTCKNSIRASKYLELNQPRKSIVMHHPSISSAKDPSRRRSQKSKHQKSQNLVTQQNRTPVVSARRRLSKASNRWSSRIST